MALIFIDGFDAGDVGQKYIYLGGSASASATTRYSSGRSLNIQGTFRKTFPAQSKIFVGIAWYWSFIDGTDRMVISFIGDNSATSHITVGQNNGRIVVRRGGTLIGTSPTVLSPNTWHYIEMSVTIDTTVGNVTVKYLGADIINFTGNTKNGGTNTTIDTVDLYATAGATFLFDDYYICDDTGSAPNNTFLGEVRVQTFSPNGAGSSTQFTPSAGANYAAVDEQPYSAADYVSSSNVSDLDLYTVADISGSPTIYGVQNNVVAKKIDAGSVSVRPAIKSGASVYYGTATLLTSADRTISDLRATDPNTSSTWDTSGINSVESGFEVA